MQIKPCIYNVGVGDNNAYLITGETNALIDTVAKYHADKLIENIEKIFPVYELDYIVINHTEQDKTGAIKAILEKNPDIEIVSTVAGLRNLKEMLNCDFNERVAKDNGTLDLGDGIILKFLITPNVNWPDSMVTYDTKNKILFSCDLFSEYGEDEDYMTSLFTYYSEKLNPNEEYVRYALERIAKEDIKMLCPGYGRCGEAVNVKEVIDFYSQISQERKSNAYDVAVIYATHYENTEEMAECIKNTLEKRGIKCAFADATQDLYGYDEEELLEADAFIFGTNTENRGADKELMTFLAGTNAYKLRGKPFFTFGSYGWSGEGPQIVHNLLKSYGMKPFSKPFTSIFNMSDEKKDELIKHTQEFAEFISKENSK